MDNALTTLVGEELEGKCKWSGTLAAPNGSLYGIPSAARRVVKFNPVDKSTTHIGPDFGDGCKWFRGAMTESGIIYCVPLYSNRRGILKIDTNTDLATELDVNLLPEEGDGMWRSCAAALDGCIYFMPGKARRIMKLDPNNNDAMSSVGDDLGDGCDKYSGTVVGIDGCVYGIPYRSNRILKYDPINDITSFFEEEGEDFRCSGNGALGRDGCIYALAGGGRVLKIDTVNNSHSFVANIIKSDHTSGRGWFDAILGIDGCIYWAPLSTSRTLKYDPHSNQCSLLVGDATQRTVGWKWHGGALATDGVIYCIPDSANQVLAIDPLEEFSAAMKQKMEQHPEELGFLFRTNANNTASNRTYFDDAVTKFGIQKVHEIMQKHMPPADELCAVCNLYPFMIASSYKESPLSVVYLLLCQVPFLITCKSNSVVGSVHCELKRKRSISQDHKNIYRYS